jgi:hypothetical protein
VFAVIGWFLTFNSNIGFMGVVFAVFATCGLCYSIYHWLHPLTWILELSSDQLYWNSPRWPRQNRAISISDIVGAWTTGGETDTVELRLQSGELVRLPPNCVGNDAARLVRELTELKPAISQTK